MYRGAIQVLNQQGNNSRIPLAAHAIREMMNCLPEAIHVPVSKGAKQRLGDFARSLQEAWDKMCKWHEDPKWTGEIDGELKKFLEKIVNFLESDNRTKQSKEEVFYLS